MPTFCAEPSGVDKVSFVKADAQGAYSRVQSASRCGGDFGCPGESCAAEPLPGVDLGDAC